MFVIRLPKPFWLKFFLVIVLLEIFLGGGGRLLDIGPISLRMYLYFFCLVLAVFLLAFYRTYNGNYVILLAFFTGLLLLSSIIGLSNGASVAAILNDIKPLLAFYALIFFGVVIRSVGDIHLVVSLLKASAIILGVCYILIFIGINASVIPFNTFYAMVAPTNEFFFRGEFAFFYKGFLYICIGLCFFFIQKPTGYKSVVLLLLAALILTFTRGFLLSVILVYVFYVVVIQRKGLKLILFVSLLSVLAYFGWEVYNNEKEFDRQVSNQGRFVQIEEVKEVITPSSAIFGHGFGIGVPSRTDRMEIAYLEIFHKQGMLGLFFWTLLVIYSWRLYKSVKAQWFTLATPFFLSIVLVYAQSFTNAFINNPIGLTIVLVSIVCLSLMKQLTNVTPVSQ